MNLSGIGMTSQRTRDRLVERLVQEGIQHLGVLDAIRTTPRHLFMDEAMASRAYEDTALPIGHGQTISQPYIVARMTEILLQQEPLDKVLEIGTGSGYQAAILSHLVAQVYSVERIDHLYRQARKRLFDMRCRNVQVKCADGYAGWDQKAPFDAIIVTAAPTHIPQQLIGQLVVGGRMIVPVGESRQQLVLITRTDEGYDEQQLEWVSFVPMLKGQV